MSCVETKMCCILDKSQPSFVMNFITIDYLHGSCSLCVLTSCLLNSHVQIFKIVRKVVILAITLGNVIELSLNPKNPNPVVKNSVVSCYKINFPSLLFSVSFHLHENHEGIYQMSFPNPYISHQLHYLHCISVAS